MAQIVNTPQYAKDVAQSEGLLSQRRRRTMIAFLFILPALINFTVFRYIPIIASFHTSLYQYSLLGGYGSFIGAEHYTRLIHDPVFWKALGVTTRFVIYKVPIQIVLSLGLAMVVQRETFGTGIVRSAILTPMVTSIIILSILWAMMYHSQLGLLQSLLGIFGIPHLSILSNPSRALAGIAVMMIWKDLGFSMIILLAGLKGIPGEYYDAALVDGANKWQAFVNITVPLLKPVLMFVIVTQTVFSFQVFVPVYQMTKGGPLDSTKAIVYYIYQQGFNYQDMGYASALAMVTLVLLLVISYFQMRFLRADA